MTDLTHFRVVLIDGPTAATLAQVLPVLLLTLMVELRRTELHRKRRFAAPLLVGIFFLLFGAVETVLVLSIDGAFYPFAWTDLAAGLVIFGLLGILLLMSLQQSPRRRDDDSRPTRDDAVDRDGL
ncbi:hypothetical protein Mycch_3104 [Mycolicibacterium chubuense NBB4]|uniref:Uncharacterized protein n=1 Tax=Mycolicibacterium chubuense (strain NBB4) TaxID=710421 RepID=I4BKP8_MYCCN|nr:hypothetical protein [Mycolicibacterium chubuense]AFM17855.1 hypothetical protein Mycch_3104 [Mycolicibacterium chubuense NBB4]